MLELILTCDRCGFVESRGEFIGTDRRDDLLYELRAHSCYREMDLCSKCEDAYKMIGLKARVTEADEKKLFFKKI